MMNCYGKDKVYRFAGTVVAAALCGERVSCHDHYERNR